MRTQAIPVRGYAPVSQGPLFDDDPGIMSEVETASTGFRRGGKQRSSLPVVRTPSKTLERPLGEQLNGVFSTLCFPFHPTSQCALTLSALPPQD